MWGFFGAKRRDDEHDYNIPPKYCGKCGEPLEYELYPNARFDVLTGKVSQANQTEWLQCPKRHEQYGHQSWVSHNSADWKLVRGRGLPND